MKFEIDKTDSLYIVVQDTNDYDEYMFWMKYLNMLFCCDKFIYKGVEVIASKLPERNTVTFYDKGLSLRTKISFSKSKLGLVVEVDQVINMKQLIKESLGGV